MNARRHKRTSYAPDPREHYARNRHIVALCFDGKNSLGWIGYRFGISRQRVAQIRDAAFNAPLPRKRGRKTYIQRTLAKPETCYYYPGV